MGSFAKGAIAFGICVIVLLYNPGFISDVLEAVPFVGQLASVLYKFLSTGEFVMPADPLSWFSWSVNEVLNSILIAVMSSFFGHLLGQILFSYSRRGILRGIQYFACDFIAIVFSCYVVVEYNTAFFALFKLPNWASQIILILIFTFVDLVIFASRDSGGFSLLSIRVFLVQIVMNLFKMAAIILVVVMLYWFITGGGNAASILSVCLALVGLSILLNAFTSRGYND